MRAADVRSLVPVEAEPAQVVELPRLGAGDDARPVEVLDPQDEPAARRARRQPGDERRGRRAQVEVAGGRRREAAGRRSVLGAEHVAAAFSACTAAGTPA